MELDNEEARILDLLERGLCVISESSARRVS